MDKQVLAEEVTTEDLMEEINELTQTVSVLNKALIRLQMKLTEKELYNMDDSEAGKQTLH